MVERMTNPWVDQATQPAMVDAMMRSMDPRLMFGAGGAMPAGGIPGWPTQTQKSWRPNTVTEGVSLDAKRNFYQSMMKMNPAMMMNPMAFMGPMGMVGSDAAPPAAGATPSAPHQGQDVNPYQQWLDAWQQMQNQQGGAAAQ